MQSAKLFAYVNNTIHDIKRILQDKQFHLWQLKSEQMWNILILWIALSTWILTFEMFSDLIVSELVICVLSVPLNDGMWSLTPMSFNIPLIKNSLSAITEPLLLSKFWSRSSESEVINLSDARPPYILLTCYSHLWTDPNQKLECIMMLIIWIYLFPCI